MKKYIILLVFIYLFPINSFALVNTDLYTQQNISGTYIESGYADIMLQRNAKNVIMEVLYNQITNYIFENTDPVTANKLSIFMPNNIQECDDEYIDNMHKEVPLNYSDEVLYICREDVYTNNLAYLIKETSVISKGSYNILLENMFKHKTKDIVNMQDFSMDKLISILVSNNLMSFNGKLFFDSQTNIPFNNIKCENNHIPLNIINYKNQNIIDNVTINNKQYFLQGCLVKNKQNFFKYIMLYEKNNDNYVLFERIPLYNHYFQQEKRLLNDNVIYGLVNRNHLLFKELLAEDTFLSFDFIFTRNNIFLLSYILNNKSYSENLYFDNKLKLSTKDISLKLYKTLLYNHCKHNSEICNTNQIEKILTRSNTKAL